MTQPNGVSRRKLFKSAGGVGAMAVMAGLDQSAKGQVGGDAGFSLDVAIDLNTFSFHGPTHDDGAPDYGSPFIIEGVIYPGGTFESKGTDRGLHADGSPEFPDEVIGKWTCFGWHVNQGEKTEAGKPWVITTQLYDLDVDDPGGKTLMSQGYEIKPGVGQPTPRVLLGRTGDFSFEPLGLGQVIQTPVGANATGAANDRFDF